jgi:hypothetical protein
LYQQLPLLKKLALSRDTYYAKQNRQDGPERYCSAGVINDLNDDSFRLWDWVHRAAERNDDEAEGIDEDEILGKKVEWAWQMQHRRRMLIEGRRYVDLRHEKDGPKLMFLYIGMLPMNVKLGWYGYPCDCSDREKRRVLDPIAQNVPGRGGSIRPKAIGNP